MRIRKSIVIVIFALLSQNVPAQSANTVSDNNRSEKRFRIFKKKDKHKYFSDTAPVIMADGSTKAIADVKVGEKVKTCRNGKSVITQVKQVDVYNTPNSSLTAVYLRPANDVTIKTKLVPALLLEAAPHHLVQTNKGKKSMKSLSKNDVLYHYEPATGVVSTWKVGVVQTNARKVTKAYNLTTVEGTYIVDNMVMAQ
ncbi:hypothetical protein [Dyadobacter sp. NIV53]|uniref:hypothetical protein n=1 Tax=Dyadobacter sp. NIV53 TaxID=2861765 RepID=UPI001C87A5CE|nr:hypothetical protein [Dyadobacter sp. NIV53]